MQGVLTKYSRYAFIARICAQLKPISLALKRKNLPASKRHFFSTTRHKRVKVLPIVNCELVYLNFEINIFFNNLIKIKHTQTITFIMVYAPYKSFNTIHLNGLDLRSFHKSLHNSGL
ncbi:hypothetical protein B853_17664 [Vibrio rotiferianus CAIM 577 = LMG 21460]|nr:hypothetical protein B853_17664 [Vibrio rotiferianus CAIM 577 = LMG 21460]